MKGEEKKGKKLIIIAISIFLSMIFIDETGVAVTLPSIKALFNMSSIGIQWVMNGMFLPLAVLVLFGGKLSDHIGYRKTFTLGMIIFLTASLLCTVAITGEMLILGRVFQGAGASLLLAVYTVLISKVFPENERGMALGTCASLASICLATGPFIAGVFSHYLSFRWIFGINLPLGLISLYFVYQCIPEDEMPVSGNNFDFPGVLLFILGFSALVYSLMQAADFGWTSPLTVGLIIFSIILLGIFVKMQLGKNHPLADLRLFKNKAFLSGNIILLCTQVVVMSLTYWAIWLQTSLHFSPLIAGIGLLPAGLPVLIMARAGGIWMDKKGPKFPITIGCLIVLTGMLWLAATARFENYWLSFPGFLLYGIGAPLIISPAIGLVLGSVEPAKRGMTSGILNTMRELGAALCFAIVGVAITNIHQLYLTHKNISHDIYTTAFSGGMLVTALFAMTACYFAIFTLKNPSA